MHLATALVIVCTAAANIAIAAADLARADFVLANSAEVNVPARWIPLLATLKASGGIALLLWFADVPLLPTLAAAALVCFFIGAVVTHTRAKVFHNMAFPGAYLALAACSLSLLLISPGS